MEEQLKELENKVDENAKRSEENVKKIYENIERLHSHDEQINKNTGALNVFSDVLKTIKTYNNKFFWMWIITFVGLILSLGLNFYLLNDINTVETETSQEISDVDTIENSNIANGDYYGEDKTKNN